MKFEQAFDVVHRRDEQIHNQKGKDWPGVGIIAAKAMEYSWNMIAIALANGGTLDDLAYINENNQFESISIDEYLKEMAAKKADEAREKADAQKKAEEVQKTDEDESPAPADPKDGIRYITIPMPVVDDSASADPVPVVEDDPPAEPVASVTETSVPKGKKGHIGTTAPPSDTGEGK
jgi:hypothetical protein